MTSIDTILRVEDASEKLVEVGVAAYSRYISGLVAVILSSSFQPHLKTKLNICHAPFGEVLNCAACSHKFM